MNEIVPDDPEAVADILEIVKTVYDQPEAASLMFKTNPDLADGFRPIFSSLVSDLDSRYSFLEDLYRQALGEVGSTETVLFLFSGPGQELLAARRFWPQGRLIAFDKVVSEASVLTQVAAGAEFHQLDLSDKKPKEIVDLVGEIPHTVISRHPNLTLGPWVSRHLSNWVEFLIPNGSKLVVTNYDKLELWHLLSYTDRVGISPKTFDFLEGVDEEITTSNGEVRNGFKSDRYVSVYS